MNFQINTSIKILEDRKSLTQKMFHKNSLGTGDDAWKFLLDIWKKNFGQPQSAQPQKCIRPTIKFLDDGDTACRYENQFLEE